MKRYLEGVSLISHFSVVYMLHFYACVGVVNAIVVVVVLLLILSLLVWW